MIKVENLSKYYGEVKAVKSINFELNNGEVVGFLGANGAGKSTTLKVMTGYLTATSGNVYVNDLDIQEDALEIQKQIGYLPELNPLYGEMRVYDLLSLLLKSAILLERHLKMLLLVWLNNVDCRVSFIEWCLNVPRGINKELAWHVL